MSEDKITQLERLSRLLKDGILSETEFEQQKKELLSSPGSTSRPPSPPHAAATIKKEPKKASGCMTLIVIIVGLTILGIIYGAINSETPTGKASDSTTITADAPKSRSEIVQGFFSAWDGSHPELESSIKKGMNDPDSYEHVETRFRDDTKTIYVVTKFRGKNAFGGTITNGATATLDGNTGHLIEWEYIK